MNIMFICSSLEIGQDGVGDYTFLLAQKMVTLGCNVSIVALNDKFIESRIQKIHVIDQYRQVDIVRLPSTWSYRSRLTLFSDLLKQHNPEWVSLQYVGFGFQKYGLPLELVTLLPKMLKYKKLHIMFHELWCGMGKGARVKEKILGFLQKVFLKVLVLRLKPQSVFTSIETYAKFLNQLNINAVTVPIFGNIMIDKYCSDEDWEQFVLSSGLKQITNDRDWLIISFFGTIYNCPGLEKLIQCAVDAAERMNKKLCILSVGVNRGLYINDIINDAFYLKAGKVSAGLVNRSLKLSHLGIVTTPADGLDKSGSAVAYLERGIPILIPSEDITYNHEMIDKGIYQIKSDIDIITAFKAKNSYKAHSRLNSVAKAYLNLQES